MTFSFSADMGTAHEIVAPSVVSVDIMEGCKFRSRVSEYHDVGATLWLPG
jgi:hypothetical protein